MITFIAWVGALFAFGFGKESIGILILFLFMEYWLFPNHLESMYRFLKLRRENIRNRKFKELDVIWLSERVGGFPFLSEPRGGFPAGSVGTIVHVYGDGVAFEVEIFKDGETVGVVTVNESANGYVRQD